MGKCNEEKNKTETKPTEGEVNGSNHNRHELKI